MLASFDCACASVGMDIPTGEPLSDNMTESQELDTIAAALLGSQSVETLLAAEPGISEQGGRALHNERMRFIAQQGSLGTVAPHAGTRGLDEAGLWVQASGSGMGAQAWGLHVNEPGTCAIGTEPAAALGSSTVGEAGGKGGSKPDWVLKKRQDMLEKNRRNQKKFRERQKVGGEQGMAADLGDQRLVVLEDWRVQEAPMIGSPSRSKDEARFVVVSVR